MIWETLTGRCVYQGQTGTRVYQNRRYRWLTFDSKAIQTLLNRRHPERSGLQYILPLTLAAREIPGSTCLLGLGGAGVAHALAHASKQIPLDAVESSAEVIEIASAWFMTGHLGNLSIIQQDALVFVQQTRNQYQHLIVDLFDAHSFPAHCNNTGFFSQCHQILLPGGVLAVNLANINESWPVFMHIRSHFQQAAACIPVHGTPNMVVLAYKGNSAKPLLNLLEHHPGIKQLTWEPKWGYVARIGKK